MYIQQIQHELDSYYSGTYALFNNELVLIDYINTPEPDGYDEDDQPLYSLDEERINRDVLDSLDLFTAYCITITPEDGSVEPHGLTVPMDKLVFTFPNTGLVNIPVNYNRNKIDASFNNVACITRQARRQWKRALRHDSLSVSPANSRMKGILESITIVAHDGATCRYITNDMLLGLYKPTYVPVHEAIYQLVWTVGTYALSPDWWVGTGASGIVFGYKSDTLGTVDPITYSFKFNDSSVSFLKDSLIEVIGVENYEA